MSDGPENLTSPIISENNGIRQEAFETQHSFLQSNWKKNSAEVSEMIGLALGEGALTDETCKKWFQRFRYGNFDLYYRQRPGQSKKFEDEELEQLLEVNST